MTDKIKIIKEIEKEIKSDKEEKLKIAVKEYMLEQLKQLDRLDKEIAELNEKRRIVKLNIDNLREGKINAIEERIEKSDKAKEVDAPEKIIKIIEIIRETQPYYPNLTIPTYPIIWWNDITSGTYNITAGGTKTFYF